MLDRRKKVDGRWVSSGKLRKRAREARKVGPVRKVDGVGVI